MGRYNPVTLPPGTTVYFATYRDELGNEHYTGGPIFIGPTGETLPSPVQPSYASNPTNGVSKTRPLPPDPPGFKTFNETCREGIRLIDGGVRKLSTGELIAANLSGWVNSEYAKKSDDIRATDYNYGEDYGAILQASGFDLSSIPANATIRGIKVRVERSLAPEANPPAPPAPPFGETFEQRDISGTSIKSGKGAGVAINAGGFDGRIFLCDGGNSLYSTDGGLTYSVGPNLFTATGNPGNRVASSDTEFLAIASGLIVSDSTDGISWSAVGNYGGTVPGWGGSSSQWAKKRDGKWIVGKFSVGHIAYSVSKTSWTGNQDIEAAAPGGMAIQGFEFNGSLWMAIGESKCCTAPDISGPWTYRAGFEASNTNWGRGGSIGGGCTWNGNVWFGFDWNSANCATSPDGINWTSRTAALIADGWDSFEDIVTAEGYGGSLYLGGHKGNFAYSSDDGASWTITSGVIDAGLAALSDIVDIEVVGSRMIILGDSNKGVYSSE